MRLLLSGPNNYTPKTNLRSEKQLRVCPQSDVCATLCCSTLQGSRHPEDVCTFSSKPNCWLTEHESSALNVLSKRLVIQKGLKFAFWFPGPFTEWVSHSHPFQLHPLLRTKALVRIDIFTIPAMSSSSFCAKFLLFMTTVQKAGVRFWPYAAAAPSALSVLLLST